MDPLLLDPVLLDPVLGWVVRLALALLFVSAAYHKGRDLRGFRATLGNYQLLPGFLLRPAALALVGCELGVAGLLVLGQGLDRGTEIAPLAALGLLALYSGALAVNLARGRRDIDCGCLGPAARQPISPGLLLRNAGLALLPLVLLQDYAARSMGWIDALSIVGATAMAALVWSAFHQLASLRTLRLGMENSA